MLLCDQLPQHNTKAEDVSSLIAPADVKSSTGRTSTYMRAVQQRMSVDAKTGTDGSEGM